MNYKKKTLLLNDLVKSLETEGDEWSQSKTAIGIYAPGSSAHIMADVEMLEIWKGRCV